MQGLKIEPCSADDVLMDIICYREHVEYDIAGYITFYRKKGDTLVYKKIPYTSYVSVGHDLIIKQRISGRTWTEKIYIDKHDLHENNIYYRSSYRNLAYEMNRVEYKEDENAKYRLN